MITTPLPTEAPNHRSTARFSGDRQTGHNWNSTRLTSSQSDSLKLPAPRSNSPVENFDRSTFITSLNCANQAPRCERQAGRRRLKPRATEWAPAGPSGSRISARGCADGSCSYGADRYASRRTDARNGGRRIAYARNEGKGVAGEAAPAAADNRWADAPMDVCDAKVKRQNAETRLSYEADCSLSAAMKSRAAISSSSVSAHRPTAPPPHRNTETPPHRNTETPSHRPTALRPPSCVFWPLPAVFGLLVALL